jgi:hypothetical protein
MKIHLLLLVFLPLSALTEAAETNELFVTEKYTGTIYVGRSVKEHQDQLLELAKTNRECLPAQDFPEGNWGEPYCGFQLSLRFEKNTYTNGEQIIAILLVRNITNNFVNYSSSSCAPEDGPVGLLVTTDKGQTVTPPATPPPIIMPAISSGNNGGSIPPHTQHKYLERLNSRYILTTGNYLVRASLDYSFVAKRTPEGKPLKLEWKLNQITSASVPIKIETSKE